VERCEFTAPTGFASVTRTYYLFTEKLVVIREMYLACTSSNKFCGTGSRTLVPATEN
jgi:hypothetical protein